MYAVLLAATEGIFDKVPLDKIKAAEANLLRELKHDHKKLIEDINSGAEPDEKGRDTIQKIAKKVAESYHQVEEKKEA